MFLLRAFSLLIIYTSVSIPPLPPRPPPFSTPSDDHSRVKLRALAGKDAKHSDYINANYVDVRRTAFFLLSFCLISSAPPLQSTATFFGISDTSQK